MAFEINGAAGPITGENRELDGNPAGGYVAGVGFRIDWQDGPLGRGEERREPNGAFVEDVLLACLERMRFYQGESEDGSGRFRCRENALIITKDRRGNPLGQPPHGGTGAAGRRRGECSVS